MMPFPRLRSALPAMAGARLAARAALALVATAIAIAPASCAGDPGTGYASGALYSTKYRSVALPIFDNATYDRPISNYVSEALLKEIQMSTPYGVTAEGRADTVLRGKVTAVRLQTMSQSVATGLPEEMSYTVTVDYDWVDMRTGTPIVSRKGYEVSAVFVASNTNT
ncbi:MAG: hypothetical protein FGM37_11615, partial [Phycisphaerales bacterium]|nr:hypothetical protein [Phycisphaerales bacterium]